MKTLLFYNLLLYFIVENAWIVFSVYKPEMEMFRNLARQNWTVYVNK